MFQAFYNGLSGMATSSKALNIVSNNVSNMQTPGYKAQDAFMSSLSSGDGNGLGARVVEVNNRFTPGDVTQTGNSTDLFIDGDALFVLQDGSEFYYSRAGLFTVDSDNNLVDKLSGLKVVGYDEKGNLSGISIDSIKSLPSTASSSAVFSGQISNQQADYTFDDLTVVSETGESVALSVNFKYSEDDQNWAVTVSDSKGNQLGNGTIEFEDDGTLKVGMNSLDIVLDGAQALSLSFGEAGSLSGLTQLNESPTSNVVLTEVDGQLASPYQDVEIDSSGKITLKYSNGDSGDAGYIALAKVGDFSDFSVKEGHILQSKKDAPIISKAGEDVNASIVSGALELSNVDLAQEFGDMIVIQRSYQASSRVLSVSNQMLEQLYNSTNG